MNLDISLVGVLNITPDSFSDGGKYVNPKDALKFGEELLESGATHIDLGAESSRPGAIALTWTEEWERLKKVLPDLLKLTPKVFVDTYHPETTVKALEAGVFGINDISSKNWPLVKPCSGVFYVGMHRRGNDSQSMVKQESQAFDLQEMKDFFANAPVEDRYLIDPGLGFGKSADDSVAIVRAIAAGDITDQFSRTYIGASRKRFLAHLQGQPEQASPLDRELAHFAVIASLLDKGVRWYRVHNVLAVKHFLQAWTSVYGSI